MSARELLVLLFDSRLHCCFAIRAAVLILGVLKIEVKFQCVGVGVNFGLMI